jgi:hypothetical protein
VGFEDAAAEKVGCGGEGEIGEGGGFGDGEEGCNW